MNTRLRPIPFVHFLLFAVGAAWLPDSAAAKTFQVSKNGSFPTIQSAVNAAGPGDEIEIASGVYRENVVIPAGKDGLSLEGEGQVILDAWVAAPADAAPGVLVISARVELRDLVIRNARQSPSSLLGAGIRALGADLEVEDVELRNCGDAGIQLTAASGARIVDCRILGGGNGIEGSAPALRVEDVTVLHVEGDGIAIAGDDVVVKECRLEGVHRRGIVLVGARPQILDCQLTNITSGAIVVEGDEARVRENAIRSSDAFGISVEGSGARVEENLCQRLYDGGIAVLGSGAVIAKNQVQDCSSRGIHVVGDEATVVSNQVRSTKSEGIRLEGSGFLIADNEVRDTSYDNEGIFVAGNSTLGTIEENDVRETGGPAIALAGTSIFVLVRGNEARSCGGLGDPTYRILGVQHLVLQNLADSGFGDGFLVDGTGSEVRANVARRCLQDGFDLDDGADILFQGNQALDNGAEGIENNSANLVLKGNVAAGNRLDLANDGTIAVLKKNQFTTGGPTTSPELD